MNDFIRALCDSGVGGGRWHQVHRKGQRGVLVTREKLAGREGEVRAYMEAPPPLISADS